MSVSTCLRARVGSPASYEYSTPNTLSPPTPTPHPPPYSAQLWSQFARPFACRFAPGMLPPGFGSFAFLAIGGLLSPAPPPSAEDAPMLNDGSLDGGDEGMVGGAPRCAVDDPDGGDGGGDLSRRPWRDLRIQNRNRRGELADSDNRQCERARGAGGRAGAGIRGPGLDLGHRLLASRSASKEETDGSRFSCKANNSCRDDAPKSLFAVAGSQPATAW
jgi:hypothetical protein